LWETIHFPLHYCLLLLLAAIVVGEISCSTDNKLIR
jgi:hypothetical protein